MNIDLLNNCDSTQRSQAKARTDGQEAGNSASGASERLSAQLTGTICEIFASVPEIRPEVVERGRKLLADATYPPQHVVERIAALVTPLSED